MERRRLGGDFRESSTEHDGLDGRRLPPRRRRSIGSEARALYS
jgi:hypothetical protein